MSSVSSEVWVLTLRGALLAKYRGEPRQADLKKVLTRSCHLGLSINILGAARGHGLMPGLPTGWAAHAAPCT